MRLIFLQWLIRCSTNGVVNHDKFQLMNNCPDKSSQQDNNMKKGLLVLPEYNSIQAFNLMVLSNNHHQIIMPRPVMMQSWDPKCETNKRFICSVRFLNGFEYFERLMGAPTSQLISEIFHVAPSSLSDCFSIA